MPIPSTPSIMPNVLGYAADTVQIPETTPTGQGIPSFRDLFPFITQVDPDAGGVMVERAWMNALFNLLGQHAFFQQSGCVYPWQATLNYIAGSHVKGSDDVEYIALQPSGPDVSGTGAKDPALEANRNYWISLASFVSNGFVPDSRRVIAGTGLTGGGALSGDVTLAAKLTDSVNLADSTTAASATAVKAAYDQGTAGVTAANAKLPLTGGTMLGSIQCGDSEQFVVGTQEAPFYQMRARIFGVHSPAGVLCGIMTADAAANYFSIEPTGGAIVNSYCGRPGSAFQHGYFANMNGHPLAATIIGGSSGDGWFYRKYSDGFIEQWGMTQTAESGDTIITFPTPFLNGIYNIQLSSVSPVYQNNFYNVSMQAYSYSITSFYVEVMNGQTKRLSAPFAWYACGF